MSTVRIVQPFWERPGSPVVYPGQIQSGPMCVFASITSATDYLAGVKLTEGEVLREFRAGGDREYNFANVLKYVRPHSPNLVADEFHDVDNPLPPTDEILAKVDGGAVLILSLQAARQKGDQWDRQQAWHMISVTKAPDGSLQVWDTNNRAGHLAKSEIREILEGDAWGIPYDRGTYLIPHDRHHCLVLSKADGSAAP